MKRLAPRNTMRRPARPVTDPLTVCVVDPRCEDYRDWRCAAEASALQIQFLASAEEALRFSRSTTVSLWVVNTRLPGLSGCELCRMLKNQSPNTAVWLVADEYSADIEREALASRATMFCCKATLWQAPALTSPTRSATVPPATPVNSVR